MPPMMRNQYNLLDIQKIKECWLRRWDEYNCACVRQGKWKDGEDGEGNGKLLNPDKKIFRSLAADSVREVNAMKENAGISYVRKTMTMTGT